MTAERWARITEVFHAAAEKPAGERAAFLNDACNGDEPLRRNVERLLAADVEPSLASPVPEFLEGGVPELASGETLAQYRVEAKVGEGGMGAVYRGYDTPPAPNSGAESLIAGAVRGFGAQTPAASRGPCGVGVKPPEHRHDL